MNFCLFTDVLDKDLQQPITATKNTQHTHTQTVVMSSDINKVGCHCPSTTVSPIPDVKYVISLTLMGLLKSCPMCSLTMEMVSETKL